MHRRFCSTLLLFCAFAPGTSTSATASAAPLLPVACGSALVANSHGGFAQLLRLGARPVATAVSERSRHTFVALAGQNGAATCRSALLTVDTATGRPLRSVALGLMPTSLAVDDRSTRVIVAGYDEALYPSTASPRLVVLDMRGRVLHPATAFSPCPCANAASGQLSVAVDESTHRAYVVTYGSVLTFDSMNGTHLATVPADVNGAGGTPNFAIDTNRHRVFVITATGVTVIDGRTGAEIQTVVLGRAERVIAADSRTGRVFVAGGGCRGGQSEPSQGGVVALDAATGKPVRQVLGACVPLSIVLDEPAQRVLVGMPGDTTQRRFTVLDAATGRVLRTVTTPAPLLSTRSAIEPSNGRIYFTTGTRYIQVLDPAGWRDAGRIHLPAGTSGSLTVAARARILILTDPYSASLRLLPTLPPPTG